MHVKKALVSCLQPVQSSGETVVQHVGSNYRCSTVNELRMQLSLSTLTSFV